MNWKMKIKKLTGVLLLLCMTVFTRAAEVQLTSPDKNIRASITTDGKDVLYSVYYKNTPLLKSARASMTFLKDNKKYTLSAGKAKKISETITAPFYRYSSFKNECNELTIRLNSKIEIVFRAYDEGIAYRFHSLSGGKQIIKSEIVNYNFTGDYNSWLAFTTNATNGKDPYAMAFQNIYSVKKLSEQPSHLAFLPVTVDCGVAKVTLLESDLEAYPGMFVQSAGNSLQGRFAAYPKAMKTYNWRGQSYVSEREDFIAKVEGKRNYPWRILAITTKDTQMPENNLVYALASPNRIGDYSWVSAGKSAWDWWCDWNLKNVPFKAGINTETYKYYIDFAASHGLQYIILDEGWYDSKTADLMHSIPSIDIPELVAYGKERGVGIVLWAVFNVLDKHIEEAFKKYASEGVRGFKVDFLDRDDQTAVEMAYRIARKAAEYKMILDYHGFYKPTGLNRTFPNIVNVESVFGMEEMKWNEDHKDMPLYDVTFPFIRMMSGPVDYTPGAMRNASKADYRPVYDNPMSMGTRCHQLATYIVHDSPFTMLADAPTNYTDNCIDFISSIPEDVDETKVLAGELGKYIVTARRHAINWYIGGMTNWEQRDVTIDFSFLDDDRPYRVVLFRDGINADKNAEDYAVDTFMVQKGEKKEIHMASGGGFAMSMEKDFTCHTRPTTPPADKHVDAFYKKYLDAGGIYIVASERVRDEALMKMQEIINMMLLKRPDIKRYMVSKGCYTMVLGQHEEVCDLPEYKHICNLPDSIAYWNKRARGFGGAPQGTYTASFGEENLLALPGDRYKGENIPLHEFAHIIHTIGIDGVDPGFNKKLIACMEHAKQTGLWTGTYALSDKYEYFAECVQSFFDCNQYSLPANGVHNAINRRVKLKEYDPMMYNLLKNYFYEISIPLYNKVHP